VGERVRVRALSRKAGEGVISLVSSKDIEKIRALTNRTFSSTTILIFR
jgi:hypothetical protein